MSVLIKGMAMPKDCRECPLQAYYSSSGNTLCFPANEYLAKKYNPIGFEGRANWCPLGEVKTPHGDLIDRDELFIPALSSSHDNEMVDDIISDAPTVIEAEGEE